MTGRDNGMGCTMGGRHTVPMHWRQALVVGGYSRTHTPRVSIGRRSPNIRALTNARQTKERSSLYQYGWNASVRSAPLQPTSPPLSNISPVECFPLIPTRCHSSGLENLTLPWSRCVPTQWELTLRELFVNKRSVLSPGLNVMFVLRRFCDWLNRKITTTRYFYSFTSWILPTSNCRIVIISRMTVFDETAKGNHPMVIRIYDRTKNAIYIVKAAAGSIALYGTEILPWYEITGKKIGAFEMRICRHFLESVGRRKSKCRRDKYSLWKQKHDWQYLSAYVYKLIGHVPRHAILLNRFIWSRMEEERKSTKKITDDGWHDWWHDGEREEWQHEQNNRGRDERWIGRRIQEHVMSRIYSCCYMGYYTIRRYTHE